MKPSIFAAVGCLFACGGIANANMFIIAGAENMMARMDAIVSPGAIGNHVHSFLGTSNVREVLNTPEEQQRAGCVSVNVAADKSNYWSPTLYYIHDNNTFSAMVASTRVYYKLKGKDVQPWPKGMRIVTGTAMSKKRETRNRSLIVGCHNKGIGMLPNAQWPDETCGTHDTVELEIDFPSCGWANQSLDSSDHFSHLTWPIDTIRGNAINPNGDGCPPSHPIKYPTMRLVKFYYFSKATPWRKGRDNVVLSNGDLHGTTFHADFVSGWDEDVLREAINTCGHVETNVGDCPAFKQSYQPDINSFIGNTVCPYQGKIPNEDVGLLYSIPQLPGCNPIWPVNEDTKPTCDNRPPAPLWVAPNAVKAGTSQNYPFVMKEEHKSALDAKDKGFYGKSRVAPWGTVGRLDRSEVMMPANASIYGYIHEDTNATPFNTVKGMLDPSAWSGMLPGDGSRHTGVTTCRHMERRSRSHNAHH